MNSSSAPTVPELLQETHRVLSCRLIEAVNSFAQISESFMPAVMADFFFQRLPRRFFRILFGRVGRKLDNAEPRMSLQALRHLVARVVRCLVNPQHDLASHTLFQHHLEPAYGRIAILPVDAEGRHLCARPKMHRTIDVLRLLASCRYCQLNELRMHHDKSYDILCR